MIKLNIEAYACNGDHYEHAEKYIANRVDLYRELEEALYILHEIEPMGHEWIYEIWADGTPFAFHTYETYMVNIRENSKYEYTVEVREI